MELIAVMWLIFGPIVGYAAAERRGFSKVGGIIGGAILGPAFAWVMFFVSGIATPVESPKKCPFCAEMVKAEAIVCKHCGRDIGQSPPKVRTARGVVVDEGFSPDDFRQKK